ncbi:MAG: hypothetical protein AAGA54_02055 [Myxococcota bacterium]
MSLRHLLVPLLSATLALPCALAPTTAQANAAGMLAVHAGLRVAEPVVTSVLGLRSEDAKAGAALTTSLRAAFAQRDMSGGEELSLEEVILTLDCSSEEDTACMTEAGRALSMERLVYGNLLKTGDGYTVDIIVLDVTTGQVEAQATLPFDGDAMSAGNVDATAAEVVESLYPSDDAPIAAVPLPADEDEDDDTDSEDDGDDGERRGGLVWGPYNDRPTWKKVGLGIGGSLLVAGVLTGAIAGGLSQFYFPDEVDAAAARARNDEDPDNNVSTPTEGTPVADALEAEGLNLVDVTQCDVARQPITLLRDNPDDKAGAVINAEVANLCGDGTTAARIGTIGWITAGVGAGITVAFTILYFVHREDGSAQARKRRHFMVTAAPTAGGGMLGAVGRF